MPPAMRFVHRMTWYVIGLLFVVAALVIALVALLTSSGTANCVNNTLGSRNDIQKKDSDAIKQGFQAIDQLVTIPTSGTPSAQQAEVTRVKLALAGTVATLTADSEFRSTHPLGRC